MNIDTLSKIINSCGLIFDIAGAWLVAWEIVQAYKGEAFEATMKVGDIIIPPEKTKEFEYWEKNKFKKMWIGLGCLTSGFFLQIGSNWIYLVDNHKETQNKASEIASPIIPNNTHKRDSKAPPTQTITPNETKPIPAP